MGFAESQRCVMIVFKLSVVHTYQIVAIRKKRFGEKERKGKKIGGGKCIN